MTTTDTTLNEKQQRIIHYLQEHAQTQSYFKSRQIGAALGLSPKEVGANITAIVDGDYDDGLAIEKWGYSSSTTWMVTLSMN